MKKVLRSLILKLINLIKHFLNRINFDKLFKNCLNFLSKNFKIILTFFIALGLADLCILFIWPALLPDESVSVSQVTKLNEAQIISPAKNNFISSKNIFHRGLIPESGTLEKEAFVEGQSQPTNFPFKLLGTIESFNPKQSMASILVGSEETSTVYFVGDVIDNKAKIQSIQRRKVIFVNLNNNRLEHIEIPLNKKGLSIGGLNLKNPISLSPVNSDVLLKKDKSVHDGIEEVEENKFAVNRSAINDHLQKLPDILQQARVNPKLGLNNEIVGHTFKWIEKGSLFESLGFKEGDTIISINDEKVNNKSEASELFQRFRTSSQFNVVVEDKNGKIKQLSYNIDEDASVQ